MAEWIDGESSVTTRKRPASWMSAGTDEENLYESDEESQEESHGIVHKRPPSCDWLGTAAGTDEEGDETKDMEDDEASEGDEDEGKQGRRRLPHVRAAKEDTKKGKPSANGKANAKPKAKQRAAKVGASPKASPEAAKPVHRKKGQEDKQKKGADGVSSSLVGTDLHKILLAQLSRLSEEETAALGENVESLCRDGLFRISSLCSGSDIAFFCTATLVEHMTHGQCRVQNLFSVEVDAAKQSFLLKHVHKHPAGVAPEVGGCVFKNINDMGQRTCACAAHERQCHVVDGQEGPVVASAGFSCKTLSPLNPNRRDARHAIATRTGSTGTTVAGLECYLQSHTPPLAILEIVPALLLANASNFATLKDNMDAIGYSLSSCLCQASKQGACVHRLRAYLFLLHREKTGLGHEEADRVLKKVVTLMHKVSSLDPIKPLEETLLPATSPLVEQELRSMQESTKDKDAALEKDVKWPGEHMKQLSATGITTSMVRLPRKVCGSPWHELLQPRARQELGLLWHTYPDAATNFELSQSLSRSASAAGGPGEDDFADDKCGAIFPKSLKWSKSQNRLITGYELCLIMNIPLANMPLAARESRNLLSDLAGNSFCGASYMAALVCFLASLPQDIRLRHDDDPAADESLVNHIQDVTCNLYEDVALDDDIV